MHEQLESTGIEALGVDHTSAEMDRCTGSRQALDPRPGGCRVSGLPRAPDLSAGRAILVEDDDVGTGFGGGGGSRDAGGSGAYDDDVGGVGERFGWWETEM
jgi:hypothetical protein